MSPPYTIERMYDSVDRALALLEESLEQLEPDALDRTGARELFEKFCRVERLGAAGKALCARRVADSGAWLDTGERSPAHWMADVAGTLVGRAVAVLETAELLQSLPATEAAYRKDSSPNRRLRRSPPLRRFARNHRKIFWPRLRQRRS